MNNIRKRIFEIIQIGNREDPPSAVFDYFIVITIVLNLVITFLSTFDELSCYNGVFDALELITIIIFTIEYLLRLWTSVLLFPDKKPFTAVLCFIFSFYGLIDLLTFFPYYLPFFFPSGMVAFRIFRVVRIFRLFKINAQYDAFNVIIEVLNNKKNQLVSSVCMIMIFVLASSLAMYSFEHAAQPEHFRNAFSGIWWAVSTLLTVGYGDIYPITTAGQISAIIMAFLGVGMVAVPTGIISAGFVEEYTKIKSYNGSEHDLRFVVSEITHEHAWVGQTIRSILLPPQLMCVMIIRDGARIIPNGDTELYENDKLILSARRYSNADSIALKELRIAPGNKWIGKRISALELPDNELILLIKRNKTSFVPDGNTQIRLNDRTIFFIS